MNISEKIYENVKALCKMNDKNMGYIETEIAGVSVGYLSREQKNISVKCVYNIAEYFGITVNNLIEKDYWEEYKQTLAEKELNDAVRRAKKAMKGCDVLQVVNKILDEQ